MKAIDLMIGDCIMTHEQFVTLETAKLAKRAGFDWEVNMYYYYATVGWELRNIRDIPEYIKGNDRCIPAPTQSVLQRWLRENKNIHIQIMFDNSITLNKYYVIIKTKDVTKTKNIFHNFLIKDNHISYFDTFEDALEAAEKKCLTLIIEKQ